MKVDRDNFDDVLARLAPSLQWTGRDAESSISLRFTEIDDFHPDRVLERSGTFDALKKLRRDLDDPSKIDDVADRLGMRVAPPPSASSPPPGTDPAPIDLLDQILLQTPTVPTGPGLLGPWEAFLDTLTTGHRVAGADPRRADLDRALQSAEADLLRALLHHPEFQSLEGLWRGLRFLTRRLDTDGSLSIWALDASKSEIAADLSAGAPALKKLLIEPTVGTPGGQPWAVISAAFEFGPVPTDLATLEGLAVVGRVCGAPVLAGASPEFLGVESLAETPDPDDWPGLADSDLEAAWSALRRGPNAAFLGLAIPRFLLRQPYGSDGESIDTFPFEEIGPGQGNSAFLWGNPAIALGEMLGRAFSIGGWNLRLGTTNEIDGLPAHIDRRGEESLMTPCAEAPWASGPARRSSTAA